MSNSYWGFKTVLLNWQALRGSFANMWVLGMSASLYSQRYRQKGCLKKSLFSFFLSSLPFSDDAKLKHIHHFKTQNIVLDAADILSMTVRELTKSQKQISKSITEISNKNFPLLMSSLQTFTQKISKAIFSYASLPQNRSFLKNHSIFILPSPIQVFISFLSRFL